jgi:hypothetical protein
MSKMSKSKQFEQFLSRNFKIEVFRILSCKKLRIRNGLNNIFQKNHKFETVRASSFENHQSETFCVRSMLVCGLNHVYESRVMKMNETMKKERESVRESEAEREKARVRMILDRSPCFYTGVNRIGSVRPVWFTPKTWIPTVRSRFRVPGSILRSTGCLVIQDPLVCGFGP